MSTDKSTNTAPTTSVVICEISNGKKALATATLVVVKLSGTTARDHILCFYP